MNEIACSHKSSSLLLGRCMYVHPASVQLDEEQRAWEMFWFLLHSKRCYCKWMHHIGSINVGPSGEELGRSELTRSVMGSFKNISCSMSAHFNVFACHLTAFSPNILKLRRDAWRDAWHDGWRKDKILQKEQRFYDTTAFWMVKRNNKMDFRCWWYQTVVPQSLFLLLASSSRLH